jgi:hypothetical protein
MRHLVLLLGVGFGGFILLLSLKFIQSLLAFRNRSSPFSYDSPIPANGIAATQHERRHYTKAPIRLPVNIITAEGTITAETLDISVGGAFICCASPLPVKEVFPLTITLPHGGTLALFAEVVWSNASTPHDRIVHRGMGVRFLRITDYDRMIFNNLVST